MSSIQTGGDSKTDQAKETAQQATQQAKETAQQATQQARGRVSDQVDQRSTQAGEQATDVAQALRQSAQQLREQGKESAAKPMEQTAERVERAGTWLRESSGDQILHDVEDFGRSKPLAVLAGGAVVGFALSRLLKASSSQRYEQRTSSGDYPRRFGGYGSSGRYGSTGGYGTAGYGTAGYGTAGTPTGPYGTPDVTDPVEPPITAPPAGGRITREPGYDTDTGTDTGAVSPREAGGL